MLRFDIFRLEPDPTSFDRYLRICLERSGVDIPPVEPCVTVRNHRDLSIPKQPLLRYAGGAPAPDT